MNNENNIQNQSSSNTHAPLKPTMEMFDFGEPVNTNNNMFEVPSAPVTENISPVMNNVSEIPSAPVQMNTPVNNGFVIEELPLNQPSMFENTNSTPVVNTPVEEVSLSNQNNMFETPGISTPVVENASMQEIQPQTLEEFSPVQEISMPQMNSSEQIVLDNQKKKASSDLPIIIVVILMIVAVFFIDEIILFVQNNILSSSPSGVGSSNGDNLYNGYIKVDDATSGISFENIRFYNFKKNNEDFSVVLNYVSQSNIKNIEKEGYYIEFYNSNKDVLYKELFVKEDSIDKGAVSTHSVVLDSNVYENVFYARVKTYSESELSKTSTLSCRYKSSNPGFNELYKHDFKFVNDMLVSYSVDKSLDIKSPNASSTKAQNDIQAEHDSLKNAELSSIFDNNSLKYSIEFSELTSNYIPLYKKGTTSFVVKNREEYLKWECE